MSKLLELKAEAVSKLLDLKQKSGKSFDEIAEFLGLTNAYTAQLFFMQAQLKPETAKKFRQLFPDIDNDLWLLMQKPPLRCFDTNIQQDPLVYRLYEAVMHYGESLRAVVNEKFGDGIMSAIDFFCSVDKVKGKNGEDRVVIVFNGKYLPHIEQKVENITVMIKQ